MSTTTDPTTRTDDARRTRALLTAGVVAGPLYVGTSLAQALTRPGFDLTRHPWSALAHGDLGWLQVTNLVVTGTLVIAFAAGLHRALGPGRGAVWAPRLVGVHGAGMVAAGVFRADPVPGFPAGTTAGEALVTWHGTVHLAAGAVGFVCLTVACLVLARRFAAEGRRAWSVVSALVGVVFLGAFVGIASGAGSRPTVLAFVVGVVVVFAWITALAASLLRTDR
ncbi:DUF998 domain-containing protein [Cellulomonas cellasea]|uniref:DUF998 domain-containing protein n=1 Tax=Cellulomonas cellasea TaxID=43670 RepID=A0A7W4UDG3_9CELL|nr:DUF998 domain-containing protein [Cellulomonas cellasea]MBB2922139.1 hypothetical protein [Cellulomonas cellasea]